MEKTLAGFPVATVEHHHLTSQIVGAVDALNGAIASAHDAGLRVEVESRPPAAPIGHGRTGEPTKVHVRVSLPVSEMS